jgi:hypothetical protein
MQSPIVYDQNPRFQPWRKLVILREPGSFVGDCSKRNEAVEKVGARRHRVSGEDVTRVRLIAGCVRLDFFWAWSLLRLSSAFEAVAHGR